MKPIAERIARLQRLSAFRAQMFGAGLFRDPAWHILLELYRCHLLRRACATKDATSASGVATGTAKRHLDLLCRAGLVQRTADPTDARRTFITLTDQAQHALQLYFDVAEPA